MEDLQQLPTWWHGHTGEEQSLIDFFRSLPLYLGRVVATTEALLALDEAGLLPRSLLARHAQGDWGDVSAAEWEANNQAVMDASQVISAYRLSTGSLIVVTTDANRQSTRIEIGG